MFRLMDVQLPRKTEDFLISYPELIFGTTFFKWNIIFSYRNPVGRTGLRGRGELGRWGPNHAADPIVTRYTIMTFAYELLFILIE